jgi:hypothetical protein
MTFHFKTPTTCQPTASPEQALGEEKRKLPFLDMLNRDLKREASPLFPDTSGYMRIKNFDFRGSYSGQEQIAITNSTNYDDHGTFNMQFKKANPIWEVLAKLPDSAITVANDNFRTQIQREVA